MGTCHCCLTDKPQAHFLRLRYSSIRNLPTRHALPVSVSLWFFGGKEGCNAGGQGQFARVAGYIEPMEDPEPGETVRFENRIVGNVIPPGYLPACEKGFIDACNAGTLIGYPVEVRE